MSLKKVTILEFAPTADEIWQIPKHNKDGYVSYDEKNGLVSILDTAHEAKPRPEIITTYAGGKATNAARVMDKLLDDESNLQVELVTFLPPPPKGVLQNLAPMDLNGITIQPSTPAGMYVQYLQIMGLQKIKPRFEIVPELEEKDDMQTTRRCIEITLKEDKGTLNFSPPIIWSQRAAEAVKIRVTEVAKDSDMLIMAGAPPTWKSDPEDNLTPNKLYASIISSLRSKCQVSIDSRGKYLYECFKSKKMPRFAFMNTDEFGDLEGLLNGLNPSQVTLIVHDEKGCWIWDGKLPNSCNDYDKGEYFPSIPVSKIFSTIGAGDSMHAGFLKEWLYNGGDIHRAVIYSQVVAAYSISNEKATHGIDSRRINDIFREILN